MFIRRIQTSTYTLRLSSPRISPTNSLSDFRWNNRRINDSRWVLYFHLNKQENIIFDNYSFQRKSISRCSSKKPKYYAIAIGGGLMIAIIVIAILVPLMGISKHMTTNKTEATLSKVSFIDWLHSHLHFQALWNEFSLKLTSYNKR